MNYSVTYKNFDSAKNAVRMFELRKFVSLSVMDGNFRRARVAQMEFAKSALEDIDAFRTLPNIKITNVPLREWLILGFRSLEFKVYKFFTHKTPEEKALAKVIKNLHKTYF